MIKNNLYHCFIEGQVYAALLSTKDSAHNFFELIEQKTQYKFANDFFPTCYFNPVTQHFSYEEFKKRRTDMTFLN